MAKLKVRCPCCGRKGLRVERDEPLAEGAMCARCAQEMADLDEQSSAMAWTVAFRPEGGMLAQTGDIRQHRLAAVDSEEAQPRYPHLKPGRELPF